MKAIFEDAIKASGTELLELRARTNQAARYHAALQDILGNAEDQALLQAVEAGAKENASKKITIRLSEEHVFSLDGKPDTELLICGDLPYALRLSHVRSAASMLSREDWPMLGSPGVLSLLGAFWNVSSGFTFSFDKGWTAEATTMQGYEHQVSGILIRAIFDSQAIDVGLYRNPVSGSIHGKIKDHAEFRILVGPHSKGNGVELEPFAAFVEKIVARETNKGASFVPAAVCQAG